MTTYDPDRSYAIGKEILDRILPLIGVQNATIRQRGGMARGDTAEFVFLAEEGHEYPEVIILSKQLCGHTDLTGADFVDWGTAGSLERECQQTMARMKHLSANRISLQWCKICRDIADPERRKSAKILATLLPYGEPANLE